MLAERLPIVYVAAITALYVDVWTGVAEVILIRLQTAE